MSFEIREAIESDAGPLANFMNEVGSEQLPYLVPIHTPFTTEIQVAHIRDFTRKENAFLLLCFNNKQIVGALDLMPYSALHKRHIARVGILVKRENRGTGIGTLLYQHLFQLIRKTDLKKIEAELFTANYASISLHLKSGFKVEGYKTEAYIINGKSYDVISTYYKV